MPELNHIGLDPKTTYIISITSKPLTFPESSKTYIVAEENKFHTGNRYITNNPEEIAKIVKLLKTSPYTTIVIDDFNYLMQDYYMANALKGGWDTLKKMGYFMGLIFEAIESYKDVDKHIIVLAHGEDVLQPDNRIYIKMKTVGKMVDDQITPEGKFDITLVGTSRFDTINKQVIKEFITNEDALISSPKSPYGMFDTLYIPNDLGYVIEKVNNYYKKN